MDYILITCTFKTKEEAERIGNELLEEHLVSCYQMREIATKYNWKGSLYSDKEYAVNMKTRKSLYPDVEKFILDNHEYEVPEIVYYDIAGGSKKYLDWIEEETEKKSPQKIKEEFLVQTVDFNDTEALLENSGQNVVGNATLEFAEKIHSLDSIVDISELINIFKEELSSDSESQIPRYKRTSEEIFASKIWSGSSDISTALASILRLRGIPTVYVQSASIEWIEKYQNGESREMVQGHDFLEIYFHDEWLLLDAENKKLYFDYDRSNPYLPGGYFVFSKSLNAFDVGCNSLEARSENFRQHFAEFTLPEYTSSTYKTVDL